MFARSTASLILSSPETTFPYATLIGSRMHGPECIVSASSFCIQFDRRSLVHSAWWPSKGALLRDSSDINGVSKRWCDGIWHGLCARVTVHPQPEFRTLSRHHRSTMLASCSRAYLLWSSGTPGCLFTRSLLPNDAVCDEFAAVSTLWPAPATSLPTILWRRSQKLRAPACHRSRRECSSAVRICASW